MKLERIGPINDERIGNENAFVYLIDDVEVDYATFKSVNKARRDDDTLVITERPNARRMVELLESDDKPIVHKTKGGIDAEHVRERVSSRKTAAKDAPKKAASEGK